MKYFLLWEKQAKTQFKIVNVCMVVGCFSLLQDLNK